MYSQLLWMNFSSLDIINHDFVQLQWVADHFNPKGLTTWWWQTIFPQWFEQVVFNCYAQLIVLIDLVLHILGTGLETTTYRLHAPCEVAFFLWFFQVVVPVSIPVREYVSVPSLFECFIRKHCFLLIFILLNSLLSSLYHDCSEVV